ncbi:uncharacterized protein VTP21DRAFT_6881 [Calcarisporiella thermophila]|uniref:uncharacterized protein n=1 Tax=Calcarisporiella thermophila TaxID=911321 RepID=UPI003742EA37
MQEFKLHGVIFHYNEGQGDEFEPQALALQRKSQNNVLMRKGESAYGIVENIPRFLEQVQCTEKLEDRDYYVLATEQDNKLGWMVVELHVVNNLYRGSVFRRDQYPENVVIRYLMGIYQRAMQSVFGVECDNASGFAVSSAH